MSRKTHFTFPVIEAPKHVSGVEVWIGDPCYVIKTWHEFLDIVDFRRDATTLSVCPRLDTYHAKIHALTHPNVFPMVYWCTADGDGSYDVRWEGKKIGNCGVDAGMLSIIPLSALVDCSRDELEKLGVIIQAPSEPLDVAGGDLTWGKLELYTSDSDPYAEPDEEEI